MKIITENPKSRKKIFNKYESNSGLAGDKEVFNKILEAYNKELIHEDEKVIIEKVLNSYKKKFNKKNLDNNDFVFTGHELNQVKNKNQTDIIRYTVYRYKFNIFPKIKKITNYPPVMQLELSSKCNLRCIMCYQHDKSFSSNSKGFMGFMKLDLFKKIIDEIEENMEAITFASRGEPTLNKDLDKYLKYCENKFMGLKLNTNATMFNEKIINTLLSSDLETLVISADAPNKELYEKIRVNGKFDKVIKNLELFKTIREKNYKNSKLKVRVSGVKINNDQSFEEINNFYSRFVDEVSLMNYFPWESSYENKINEITDPCTDLWRIMFVYWDGTVNPCDFDYKSTLSKWNAKSKTIKDIWNSEYYNELRNKHLNKLRKCIEPCARCIAT